MSENFPSLSPTTPIDRFELPKLLSGSDHPAGKIYAKKNFSEDRAGGSVRPRNSTRSIRSTWSGRLISEFIVVTRFFWNRRPVDDRYRAQPPALPAGHFPVHRFLHQFSKNRALRLWKPIRAIRPQSSHRDHRDAPGPASTAILPVEQESTTSPSA